MDLLKLIRNEPQAIADMISESEVQVFVCYDDKGKVLYASPGICKRAPFKKSLDGSNIGDWLSTADGEAFAPEVGGKAGPVQWQILKLFASDVRLRCSVRPVGENFLLVGELMEQSTHSSMNVMAKLNNELANLSRDLRMKNQMLTETEHRLRTILESIQTGVLISEPKSGLIRYANPAALFLLSASSKQVEGQSRDSFINKGEGPGDTADDNVNEQEAEIIRVDGGAVPVALTTTQLIISGYEMLLECFWDMTHMKKAQEERLARKTLQAAIETAGAACHELNQPLQVMTVVTECALEEVTKGSQLEQDLKDLMVNIQKMARATRHLSNITSYKTISYSEHSDILDLEKSSMQG